jgi:sulfur carrier protein
MKLIINGTEQDVAAHDLVSLVEALGMKGDRVAIELNGDIVTRARWAEASLKDGDKLEIVHFVGGG